MEKIEGNDESMRKEEVKSKKYIILLRFAAGGEAFDIGAPHIENESFETVRFVMLMKARPNCPTHLIMVLLPLSPTREMLLTF